MIQRGLCLSMSREDQPLLFVRARTYVIAPTCEVLTTFAPWYTLCSSSNVIFVLLFDVDVLLFLCLLAFCSSLPNAFQRMSFGTALHRRTLRYSFHPKYVCLYVVTTLILPKPQCCYIILQSLWNRQCKFCQSLIRNTWIHCSSGISTNEVILQLQW